MFRNAVYAVTFISVLGLVGDVQAVDMTWSDATGDHLWSTPQNWDTGTVPTFDDYPRIALLVGPTIANEGAAANLLGLGYGGGSVTTMTVDGGSLEIITYFQLGLSNGCEATCDMISGTLTSGHILVGDRGSGTLNMTNGTITVNGLFRIGHHPTSIGHVNLDGGTINTSTFDMRGNVGSVGTMDVGGGMLTINGDQISLVQGYIDDGWITAYDGDGAPDLDYNVTNPGQTTLMAVHKLNPNPANRAIVKPGAVDLSWTLPDPCVPGQAVFVDVYFTDDFDALWNFTDPEAIKVVNKQNVASVVVQTQTKTRYFWAVDTYIGSNNDPILGPIFTFLADNAPPFVNAGPDISTFLQDGTRTGPVSGIVTDDGAIQPYTVMWSVLEQPSDADPTLPSAVIADPTALQTTVTVSAEGVYVLQLEANDGEYTSSDTMTINVHPDDWTNNASGQ